MVTKIRVRKDSFLNKGYWFVLKGSKYHTKKNEAQVQELNSASSSKLN